MGQPVAYVGLSRDAIRLHLIPVARTTRQPGHGALTIDVGDVDALHAELVRRGARIGKPPQDQSYGMREFDIVDPDGNMIFFAQELNKA